MFSSLQAQSLHALLSVKWYQEFITMGMCSSHVVSTTLSLQYDKSKQWWICLACSHHRSLNKFTGTSTQVGFSLKLYPLFFPEIPNPNFSPHIILTNFASTAIANFSQFRKKEKLSMEKLSKICSLTAGIEWLIELFKEILQYSFQTLVRTESNTIIF